MADPLQQVLDTTNAIMLKSTYVTINDSLIEKCAAEMAKDVFQRLSSLKDEAALAQQSQQKQTQQSSSSSLDRDPSFSLNNAISHDGFVESLFIEWDNEKVHFRDLNDVDATAQYILVLSAMNFCFWPYRKNLRATLSNIVPITPLNSDGTNDEKEMSILLRDNEGDVDEEFEYCDLAGSLRDVLLEDRSAFDASNLIHCSEETLFRWFKMRQVPLAAERARLIREVGLNLQRHFDGKASKLIQSANKSVVKLVSLVTAFFPGFRDHSVYALDGRQCFFYKRAQIFCADVWGAFKHQGLGEFTDLHRLTMFADYRVPQIMRHYGILEYAPELANTIDSKKLIPSGSVEELEIRAATVQAVETLKHILQKNHRIRCKSVELDWLLWQRGEEMRHDVQPHHRTLTIYY